MKKSELDMLWDVWNEIHNATRGLNRFNSKILKRIIRLESKN